MNKVYNCTGHTIQISNIVNSDGIYLFDDKGKRYMDFESGVWCTSLGHKNIQINNLIKKQIDSIMHAGYCYSNNVLQEAAESVLSITNFKEGKCVFLCSGSESIELARQISKHITQKKMSMTLHDSYLGSYSTVTDRSQNWYIFNWEKCKLCPDRKNCKTNCEELQKIPDGVSEFIFEPGSSSGFVRFPPKSLIQNIVNVVRENGGKIIANEVTTGIGRTGKWFGHNHYQIEPDMIAIGKGIGNGYPVSITAINRQTIDQLEKSTFKYMQSHQNDPLGAAIVNEVIKIIKDEDLISKAEIKGAKFFEELQTLIDKVNIIDVRGRGLMFAIDICNEKIGDSIYLALLDKGYIVCNRKSLFRIDPPLSVNEDEFCTFIEEFRNILSSRNIVI
ncbi:MAG: aminotransferase class III-fold pyridoxal phosphate-dependent enzyme [Deltaproteobacteria bacterium]|nr:aminotransferase class III-fold pyridoxal phosphate-dependent enzyme [Deltaproteobacteria bacterium]